MNQMPKRSSLTIDDVAAWDNLVTAAYRASQGKRSRPAIIAFLKNLDANLLSVREELLDGSIELGKASSFEIYDPKPRTIHAPAFRERVLHHALMAHVGPVLDKSLVADTFACRTKKGVIAAVKRTQQHARRFGWFGKLDVRKYFSNICHATLIEMLERKFKNRNIVTLLQRIVGSYHSRPGFGLPIGALTSQAFANFYLSR
jgi:RNA-directed DNA polymerase